MPLLLRLYRAALASMASLRLAFSKVLNTTSSLNKETSNTRSNLQNKTFTCPTTCDSFVNNRTSILNKGTRIALRSKVNESVVTGLSIVDVMLPIGRGQRQLVLGDRNTGKSSIFLSTLINSSRTNALGSIDGLGSKRLMGIYVAINQNLSKLVKFIDYLNEFKIH